MLKAVSARRGMPFEWSFLLDALQTERDQGITIDTTQIRFRTGSRDVVLIDAPGHAEFLRNMITGASQADGAVLIIDALEGVRDQTRRHGYLLHLLGVKQVAVVVNKMDRVDFSAARFNEISDEISAHLIGLGVTPSAVIPISARDGDGVADAHAKDRLVQGPDRGRSARCARAGAAAGALALRLPVQAIYKFDDRRIVAGRIESGSLAAGDEIVIMPAGKIAKIRSVEGWPATPVTGRADRRAIGRHHARPRTVHRTRRRHRPCRRQPARYAADSRADFLAARQAAGDRRPRSWCGSARARPAPPWSRSRRRSIPANLSSVETKSIARNHVGEIDIALAQPIAADPYADNPRTGRLVIEVNGRIAGGGLVLSVDAGQRAIPVDIVPVESALRPDERSARYRHQRRGGLADRIAGLRQIDAGARAGAPAVRQWRLAGAARRRYLARRPQPRSRLLRGRSQREHPPARRSRHPSRAQRPHRHRRRGLALARGPRRGAPDRRHLVSAKSMSRRLPKSARAAIPRATTPRPAPARCTAFTGIGNDYQPPTSMRAGDRHLDALGRRGGRGDRADAGDDRRAVRRTRRSRCQYLRPRTSRCNRQLRRAFLGPGFGAKRALKRRASWRVFCLYTPENGVLSAVFS